MEWLTYLAKEWGVIGQAPFTFLMAATLAGLLGYGIARLIFTARLDTASDRLKLKDERVADLERKLDELQQASESPPPTVEAHGDGSDDHSAVIRQLVSRYIFESQEVDPEILAGRELPSMRWMNHQLHMMGKDWRITNVRGPIAEIGPA